MRTTKRWLIAAATGLMIVPAVTVAIPVATAQEAPPAAEQETETVYSATYEPAPTGRVARDQVKDDKPHGKVPKEKGEAADVSAMAVYPYDSVERQLRYGRPGGPGWANLRRGSTTATGGGCCWAKINAYHKITDQRALNYVAGTPTWAASGGTSWAGTAYANEFECSSSGCIVKKSVEVRALVDERRVDDSGNKGMFTAYCLGYNPECPPWVTVALVNADSRS